MTNQEDSLYHFGVMGMKWGRRKGATSDTATPSPPNSSEHLAKVAIKTQAKQSGVKTLSNAQLKTAIDRIQLEQQYSKLNQGKIAYGHAKVKALLTVAATGTALFNLLNSPASAAVNDLVVAAVKKVAKK